MVVTLFLAVRRLRSFIAFAPASGDNAVVAMPSVVSSEATDGGVGTLLRDAMLRARLPKRPRLRRGPGEAPAVAGYGDRAGVS